jgi:hypothetical protein
MRSAQSAGAEIIARLRPANENSSFVGGWGRIKKAPQLSAEEILIVKSFLAKL